MSLFSQLLAITALCMLLAGVLFVLFGQITVNKLRNNPKTKDVLGFEYMSGLDIVNVAQALAFPKSWSRKLAKSPLSTMFANSDLLFENTNKFDQILGAIFYWLLIISAFSGGFLILFESFGLFDS